MASRPYVAGVGMIPVVKSGANAPYHVLGGSRQARDLHRHLPCRQAAVPWSLSMNRRPCARHLATDWLPGMPLPSERK
jgi:hypothetical protein